MNNSFSVEKKVFEVLPDYCVGVIRTSIPNKEGAANAVSELFRNTAVQNNLLFDFGLNIYS